MTGFDPTAPQRDARQDPPDEVEGNVVPPSDLVDGPVPGTDDEQDDEQDGGD